MVLYVMITRQLYVRDMKRLMVMFQRIASNNSVGILFMEILPVGITKRGEQKALYFILSTQTHIIIGEINVYIGFIFRQISLVSTIVAMKWGIKDIG